MSYLITMLQHVHQLVNVLQGVVDDVHLGHLLVDCRRGHTPPQVLKAGVDRLHPVPLPGVPLDCLEILLGCDGIPMHRVNGNQLSTWSHSTFTGRGNNNSVFSPRLPKDN